MPQEGQKRLHMDELVGIIALGQTIPKMKEVLCEKVFTEGYF